MRKRSNNKTIKKAANSFKCLMKSAVCRVKCEICRVKTFLRKTLSK